jgi:DNA-binding XRE family transcriptional regulator
MTNLPHEICLKFKEARQAKGYNQSTLARMVGCKQSAVSMFEAGMTTKLSDETVKKMADILGVSLEAKTEVSRDSLSFQSQQSSFSVVHGYCPNCECPSNVPYVVSGRLFYRPLRDIASPTGGTRCTQCGELLEMKCPTCGSPLNDGACCTTCGNAYVTPAVSDEADVTAYARMRHEEIERFYSLVWR